MNKFFIAFLFLLISCQNSPPQNVNAVAVIQPGNGYNARGNVLFEQDGAEVIIKVNISGLNRCLRAGEILSEKVVCQQCHWLLPLVV